MTFARKISTLVAAMFVSGMLLSATTVPLI